MKRIIPVLCLVGAVAGMVGCDHATKNHAEKTLSGGGSEPLVGNLLRMQDSQNHGFAFSVERFLPDVPRNATVVTIRLVMLVVMLGMWFAYRREGWLLHGAFALTVAGALGNLVDGITRGYVVDFLHLRGWPIFNLADVYIVAGALLLGIALYRATGDDDTEDEAQRA